MLINFKTIVQKYYQPKNVIHIGAHYAEEIKDYYDNGVESTFWVEGNPELMEIIKANISNYPNASCINACLSDTKKWVEFNVSNNEGQSSSILQLEYHKIAHAEVNYTHTIGLNTETLNELFQRENISLTKYDFMNADIQGAELLMLHGATDILPNLKCLYLEVNEKELYKECGLVGDIDEFLKKYNFSRVETEWCGNFGWGDAIYIK